MIGRLLLWQDQYAAEWLVACWKLTATWTTQNKKIEINFQFGVAFITPISVTLDLLS